MYRFVDTTVGVGVLLSVESNPQIKNVFYALLISCKLLVHHKVRNYCCSSTVWSLVNELCHCVIEANLFLLIRLQKLINHIAFIHGRVLIDILCAGILSETRLPFFSQILWHDGRQHSAVSQASHSLVQYISVSIKLFCYRIERTCW